MEDSRGVPGDGKSGLLAEGHAAVLLDDTLIPALDDSTSANGDIEVTTADGGVKPRCDQSVKLQQDRESVDLLLALLAALGDPTSVLHGDVVAVLGVGRAIALLDDLLGDTHVD